MKREDVKNKIPGITDDQLDWLMSENGADNIVGIPSKTIKAPEHPLSSETKSTMQESTGSSCELSHVVIVSADR